MGSRSSIGFVSGAISCTASFCAPLASRTWMKSSSDGRRSHSRALIASDHSELGSGLAHSSASRCCRAALRTFLRTCPR